MNSLPPDASGSNPRPPAIPDYELLKRIGEGSYGEVWLARNVTGILRAAKIVHRRAFESDRPFDREFAGIQRFEPVSQAHESQLKIFHVGRRDGFFYYVMELADCVLDCPENAVTGPLSPDESSQSLPASPATYLPRTLRNELQRRGRLPMDEVLEISLKLTEALVHLHSHGLVHRDIKPSNIIFVKGQPKLADIGLVADMEGTLTFVGTEGYLPPEGPGKPPADIFSLGKVLYEISTGHDRNQFPEVPVRWDSSDERDAFAEFNEVMTKACAADASQRYESAGRMHADILLLRAGKSLQRLRFIERRSRWLIRAAAVLALLAGLVTAGWLYERHQSAMITNLARQESAQRQRAENALTQAELVRISEMLERGAANQALMQLAYMLRHAPTNRLISERLMAVLYRGNFLVPLAGPLQHTGEIKSACFSPDGRWIATASDDGTAGLWDVTASRTPIALLKHGGAVNSVQFSADSRMLLTASIDSTVRIWKIASETTAHATLLHDHAVNSAEFSADGRRVLTISGDEIRVWDVATGRVVGDVMRQSANVIAARFSPDGQRVAVALRDLTARVWDPATGQALTPVLRHDLRNLDWGGLETVAFSPDGRRIVTAGSDGTARIWDSRSGEPCVAPLRHEHPVRSARFSPDGTRVFSVSDDRRAQLWDAFTGEWIMAGFGHDELVGFSEFSPDGRSLVTVQNAEWRGVNDIVRVWDTVSGRLLAQAQLPEKVQAVAISRDGRRLLSSAANRTWIWDLLPGETRAAILPHSTWVTFAQFSPDGDRIVTAENSDVATPRWAYQDRQRANTTWAAQVWGTRNGRRLAAPLLHAGGLFSAEFSRDGTRIVTASRDQTVRVWDAATGSPQTDSLAHPQMVRFARFTPDSQRLIATAWLDRAWKWDASSGILLKEFHGSGPGEGSNEFMPVRPDDLSADGRWLATSSRDGVRVWDVASGELFRGPFAAGENIRAVRFSPEGGRIVTSSFNHQACVWDVQSGRVIAGPLRHNWSVIFAQFSPDGRRVVTCSLDRTARIWDAETGEPVTKPLPHKGEVVYAEFSPDSRRLVTASWRDKAALLWDAATGLPLSQPLQHEDSVNFATFSPDGHWIVTVSNDRTARVWEVPSAPSPMPGWLPELAEAFAGMRLNSHMIPEAVPVEKLFELKERLSSATDADDYTRWARWLFADRSQRTISAFSSITIPEYVEQRIQENTLRSLEEAVRLAPRNGLAYARLARQLLEQTANKSPRIIAEADFYSRHAAQLAPDHPEVLQRRAGMSPRLDSEASAR